MEMDAYPSKSTIRWFDWLSEGKIEYLALTVKGNTSVGVVENLNRFKSPLFHLHPAVVQKPALFCVLPTQRRDAGQLDHATHHAEVQRQPGCCQKCQPQPGGLHQGWDLRPVPSSPVCWWYIHWSAFSSRSAVSTWWTEASCSNKSTTTWAVLRLETQR